MGSTSELMTLNPTDYVGAQILIPGTTITIKLTIYSIADPTSLTTQYYQIQFDPVPECVATECLKVVVVDPAFP